MVKLDLIRLKDTLGEPVDINPDTVVYVRGSKDDAAIAVITFTNGHALEVQHTPNDASALLKGQVPWRATNQMEMAG